VSRVRKYYESRCVQLAAKLGRTAEQLKAGFFANAINLCRELEINSLFAWAILHADLRQQTGETHEFPQRFLCDAGLGGLARWLRAAGFHADWNPELNDAAVISKAQEFMSTLITTDSLMMERGILRDGQVPSVWLPPSISSQEHLAVVLRELGLSARESRCMQCGGELIETSKEAVADRIPPRTALWLDEYFLCPGCGGLFWRGTHWKRIEKQLEKISALSSIGGVWEMPSH
jgi:uncharacterized protein